MTGWQAINNEFSTFASLPADAISYPLRIVGDTRSAAAEFVDLPARTGDGLVPADAPQPLAPSTGRGRL